MKTLRDIIPANEEPLSRRAAWPLRILHMQKPELFTEWTLPWIDQLENIKSKAVLRNVLALLANSQIPENKKSFLLNYSTHLILDSVSPVAVIAHASDLFVKIASNEIALMAELLLMLKQIEQDRSCGIQAKTRSVAEKLIKLKLNRK